MCFLVCTKGRDKVFHPASASCAACGTYAVPFRENLYKSSWLLGPSTSQTSLTRSIHFHLSGSTNVSTVRKMVPFPTGGRYTNALRCAAPPFGSRKGFSQSPILIPHFAEGFAHCLNFTAPLVENLAKLCATVHILLCKLLIRTSFSLCLWPAVVISRPFLRLASPGACRWPLEDPFQEPLDAPQDGVGGHQGK